MTTYYGLTLGPIYKTLGRLRKTRELWGGSFYFSLLMRRIVEAIKASGLGIEILLPYPDVPEQDLKNGVGLFPDRLIATGPAGQGDALYQLLRGELDTLSREIAGDVTGWAPETVAEWFGEYIQTYLFEGSYNSPADAILGLNELMDSAELMPPFQKQEKEKYLLEYLDEYAHTAESLFMIAAYGSKESQSRVLSIPEIACMGMTVPLIKEKALEKWWIAEAKKERERKQLKSQQKLSEDEQKRLKETDLYDYFFLQSKEARKNRSSDLDFWESITDQLRTHHRYIAIIHADGDNVGSSIKKLRNGQEVREFSESLFHFSVKASMRIKKYRGTLVYAGGDDLLFFAPVLSGEESIFSLCRGLDEDFKSCMPVKDEAFPPSLSFGVSISYHKFPLYEALEDSRNLLFETAKKWPPGDKLNRKKNALSLRLLKHSGQHIGQTFELQSSTFEAFYLLLNLDFSEENRFLSSIMFMLDKQQDVLDYLGSLPKKQRMERMTLMMDANFDEDIHQESGKFFVNMVKDLIVNAYEDYPDGKKARAAVYSALRTIHFLKQPYDA